MERTHPDDALTHLSSETDSSRIRNPGSRSTKGGNDGTAPAIPTLQPSEKKIQVLFCCKTCAAFESCMRCGACGVTPYCSKQCQRYDWPTHKPSCKEANGADDQLVVARKLIQKLIKKDVAFHELAPGKLYWMDVDTEAIVSGNACTLPPPERIAVRKLIDSLELGKLVEARLMRVLDREHVNVFVSYRVPRCLDVGGRTALRAVFAFCLFRVKI